MDISIAELQPETSNWTDSHSLVSKQYINYSGLLVWDIISQLDHDPLKHKDLLIIKLQGRPLESIAGLLWSKLE